MKFAYFLIILSCIFFAVTDLGYASEYEPMIYEEIWQALSRQDIDERMRNPVLNINNNRPFNFKVIDKNDKEAGRVNTPAEYYDCIKAGNSLSIYTTYDIIDEGLFRGVAMPLLYLSKAKVSSFSYVRDFPFNLDDPLSVLPADFVSYAGSDQKEVYDKAVQENRPWRYLSPSARILKADASDLRVYDTFDEDMYNVPQEGRYQGDMPSHCISPVVLGDLNGDGYEDIVLNCAHYYVEGSGRSYNFVILTRKSQEEVLKDITDEVNDLIWKD